MKRRGENELIGENKLDNIISLAKSLKFDCSRNDVE